MGKRLSIKDSTQMLVTLSAEGPAIRDDNGSYSPEEAIAEVLEDLAAQLRSGTRLTQLHGDKLRAWNGQHVGVVLVTAGKPTLS